MTPEVRHLMELLDSAIDKLFAAAEDLGLEYERKRLVALTDQISDHHANLLAALGGEVRT